jgi:diacylglycerol kinase (ATP)
MARELGLPADPARAALAALAGTIRPVHPGTVNGRLFLLMAGMGFDAEAVWRVSLALKRVVGKAAYGWAGLQTLLAPPDRRPGLRIGGQGPIWRWVVAARAGYYAGGYRIHPGAALQAAELGVVGVAPGAVLPVLARLALGRLPGGAGVHMEQRPALRVEADAPAHLQVDGDYCLTAREFEIGISAQSLPLCFPDAPRAPGAAP